MMKFGIREIVFIAFLTAIPVGAWWFVFRPADIRDAEMLKQIRTRQAKLQELNKATATIGDLKSEIISLKKAINFFQAKLPTEKEMDQVLRDVWKLAEANKLITKSIRTLKPTQKVVMLTDPTGPYTEQPISIELEGPFEGYYGFLLALETQPRIMRIQQMEVKKLPKKGEGYICATCIASVFFERGRKD